MSHGEVLRLMDDLVEGKVVLEGVTEKTSDEDTLKAIHDKGYDVQSGELNEFLNALGTVLQEQGKLSDDDLENVAGGLSPFKALRDGLNGAVAGASGGLMYGISKAAGAVGADSVSKFTEGGGELCMEVSKESFRMAAGHLQWDE